MKRQTQVLGVRNWYGDAFVSLQEEPLKVIDGFFSQYGAFVLSGCEVKANGSKYDIAPGLVVLEGSGADNATVKVVVPFARDYCDSPARLPHTGLRDRNGCLQRRQRQAHRPHLQGCGNNRKTCGQLCADHPGRRRAVHRRDSGCYTSAYH